MSANAIPDEVLELLQQPVFPFVATTFPDGRPQNTPVWIDVIDGRPVFNTAVGRVKEKNLRRDPRVSLSFTSPDDPYKYYELRGTAEFSTDGADQQIDRLAKKYIGQDTYPWRSPGEQRVNVFVNVDRVSGMGG
jgi:PPOX class probable F420-dependent enzyme